MIRAATADRACRRITPSLLLALAVLAVLVLAGACRTARPEGVALLGRWHTLERGETLAEVAARYRVPLDDLLELNAIGDTARVEPGTELFIPDAPLRPPPAAASRAAPGGGSAPGCGGSDDPTRA